MAENNPHITMQHTQNSKVINNWGGGGGEINNKEGKNNVVTFNRRNSWLLILCSCLLNYNNLSG